MHLVDGSVAVTNSKGGKVPCSKQGLNLRREIPVDFKSD